MEILVGPAFSIEVSSPSSKGKQQPSSVFLNEKDEESPVLSRVGSDVSSDTSSSIGAPDDSDSEDDETNSGAVSSKNGAFGSLDSLEDSLPIKRGLSNYFNGKSKSFMNLSEVNLVSEVKELEKPENPFNKRRRILMTNKWSTRKNKKSTFYTWSNPKSMPLLPLNEDDDDEGHSQQNSSSEKLEEEDADSSSGLGKLEERKLKASLKYYQSCLDLHELQDLEEEYE